MQWPICNVLVVVELDINRHLDSNCGLGRFFSDSNSLAAAASSSSRITSSSKKTEDLKSVTPIFGHAKKRPTIERLNHHPLKRLKILILVKMTIYRHQRNFIPMNVLLNDRKRYQCYYSAGRTPSFQRVFWIRRTRPSHRTWFSTGAFTSRHEWICRQYNFLGPKWMWKYDISAFASWKDWCHFQRSFCDEFWYDWCPKFDGGRKETVISDRKVI